MELALKKGMSAKHTAQASAAAVVAPQKLERELSRVEARRNQLWAELAEQAEEMSARAARGAPVKRLLAQHDRMRERYCAVEERRQDLLAQLPPVRAAAADDF
jgi:predicted RNase H-like nuclease (RuvC/YqgF family)